MGEKKIKVKDLKEQKKGKLFLILFTIFIMGGIITKRIFGHPEWMMAWHLPAAIFLVLGGKKLTRTQRERYFKRKMLVNSDSTLN